MAGSAKIIVLASLGFLVTASAGAEPAAAPTSDRCEGTLCDLYYGSRGNSADPAAKPASPPMAGVPAGATPIVAPSSGTLLNGNPLSRWFGGSSSGSNGARPSAPDEEPAAASNSYMHLGSGGLLGNKQERCTGTLCDTIYGSSPPEAASAGSGQKQANATPAASATEPVIAYRHIPHESEFRPKCSSPASDPWRCFRK